MLPGVRPTGRRVEAAFAVVVGFENGKVSHEHIYWDQASVLVQLGLLDLEGLPVTGAEAARKVLDPHLPGRTLAGSWPQGFNRWAPSTLPRGHVPQNVRYGPHPAGGPPR
jgi:carboxymethylenebutenolidase